MGGIHQDNEDNIQLSHNYLYLTAGVHLGNENNKFILFLSLILFIKSSRKLFSNTISQVDKN